MPHLTTLDVGKNLINQLVGFETLKGQDLEEWSAGPLSICRSFKLFCLHYFSAKPTFGYPTFGYDGVMGRTLVAFKFECKRQSRFRRTCSCTYPGMCQSVERKQHHGQEMKRCRKRCGTFFPRCYLDKTLYLCIPCSCGHRNCFIVGMTLRPRLEIVNGKRQGFAKPQKPKKLKAGHDRHDRHDRHEANNGRGHKAGLGRGRGAGRGRGMAVSETEAWKSGRQVSLSAGCQVLSGSVECGFWNVSHVATVQASSLYCVIS